MTASQYLSDALDGVQSPSIRAWATTEHNHPIFLQIAQKGIDNGSPNVVAFTAYIVCLAIGA